MSDSQILTVAQMQAAEQAVFDTGTTVEDLMEIAAGGAAEWIRRIAAGRSITVLCGPGNNGGDGYVIARRLREYGNQVSVIAPIAPTTDAAKIAREKWGEAVSTSGNGAQGGVFVDCLFGSGLSRPLSAEHALLLRDLSRRHSICVAVDLPSGVESDSGTPLNDWLPRYDVTLALGAWKFAHWQLLARTMMGTKRLVPIGVPAISGAARLAEKPRLLEPAVEAHKYVRGLALVIGGTMPGASVLAATAAQRAGAGYVKLLSADAEPRDHGLVAETGPIAAVTSDNRIRAILIGPGLGRGADALARLQEALTSAPAKVLDADALMMLKPGMLDAGVPTLATPHDGELDALCRSFSVIAEGRRNRALALAKASGMVVCAKGPDTFIASPDGKLVVAPPASCWLSVAGSGDVLAGIATSRMAAGLDPFAAACEAVWLHGEAARRCPAPFTAEELARGVSAAYRACL